MENSNIQTQEVAVTPTATAQVNSKEGREFKEERFDFEIYVNDNLICKRNFKINNFINDSMNSMEFKDVVDGIVYMLDEDLKSKSRIYTHYNYIPGEEGEFTEELAEPWACTFKFVVLDNKKVVISKIWDGYAYPRAVRERVDFTNKVVKIVSRTGQVFFFDKDTYFAERGDMLSHELYVLKQQLLDREDVLLNITKRICAACSPQDSNFQNVSDYTLSETYASPNTKENAKKYAFAQNQWNAKYISDWGNAVSKKTKEYFANLR